MFAFKNVKLIVLGLLLLASVFLLVYSLAQKAQGAIITEIDPNSTCVNVKVGSKITQLSGMLIKSENDFNRSVANAKKGDYINMVVDGEPANCIALSDGDLGVQVRSIRSEPLRFGTDIAGGSIFAFKPSNGISENMTGIVKIIEKRIKFFGLPQTKVYEDGNLIKIESFKDVDLNRLTMVGRIDAKIIEEIKLENETGKIKIGSDSFTIKIGDKITVNGVNYSLGEKFEINNVSFKLVNSTKDYAIISADIYSNKDINGSQAQFGTVKKIDKNAFQFTIPVTLSKDASSRFSQITKGMGISQQIGRGAYLNGKIIFYVDDYPITVPLDIPIEFAGKDIGVIVGFGKTEAEANNEMKNVQAILSFGQLPGNLTLASEEVMKPMIGILDFGIVLAVLSILFIACIAIGQARYKKAKLGVYVVLLSAAEIVCLIGIVALLQRFSSYGIVIDFPVLIGLVVSASFTMTKMLISTEEDFKKMRLDVRYKYKKIIGLKNLLNVCLILVSLVSFSFGYSGFGYVLLINLFINFALTNLIYKDLLKKSAGHFV